ncbi:hypothetical protein EDD11_008175 [Mortierella claussenii]|nr:hypothetical protein EDD11_008175 [Mortierella claussenii]
MSCSHPLGLGIAGPLVLNVLTAPAERIKLLLQTQDEIILNLREESLAAHVHHHHQHHTPIQNSQEGSGPVTDNGKQTPVLVQAQDDARDRKRGGTQDDDDDDDDDEPRSIIVPYAQLPYTDVQDCMHRLVEKEGIKPLWRGYGIESVRFLIQSGIESALRRKQALSVFGLQKWLLSHSTETVGGSAAWILGAAIDGTMISAVALVAVYPLAVMQTRMATDVVRKTRTNGFKKTMSSAMAPKNESLEEDNKEAEAEAVGPLQSSFSVVGSDAEAVEWIYHTEEQENTTHTPAPTASDLTSTTTLTPAIKHEQKYFVSYKYKDVCDVLQTTIESSKDIWSLYNGFSTVLASSFVSRIGFLTIYRMIAPLLVRTSSSGSTRGGNGVCAFLLILGATSVVNLMVYPLSTICHRRMISAPGRYTSSWDAGKQIVEKQGWKALYKGCEVAMARSAVIAILSRIFL